MRKQKNQGPKKNQARQIKQLQKENDSLEKENAQLKKENEELKNQINSLREQLNKDSHNSSKPPSTDGFKKKTKSLRKPSGKKPGGQPGHAGHTLEMVENPDHITVYRIDECENCGYSLDSKKLYNVEHHQVFDIPTLKMEVVEHQAEMKICPKCGAINKAKFPSQASNIVQYGERINSLVSYLSNYQLIPLERVKEFMTDLFNHPLSKATVIEMNRKTHQCLQLFEQTAKEKISNSSVVHADESGFYCENKRQWLHCASTKTITHYQFHPKRGKEAMDEIAILPYFKGVLIHDFWKPYLKYSCAHGLCNAHHLRELIFLIEEKNSTWAYDMKKLLLEIKEKVDTEKTKPGGVRLKALSINKFENRYDKIIDHAIKIEQPTPTPTPIPQPPPPDNDNSDLPLPNKRKRGRQKKSKSLNLLTRLKEHKEKVLAFMYDFEVPFDNNQGERDIRMIKLRQKISGTFRTKQGAEFFCRIRSYISTARKNDINVFSAINDAIRGQPFIPIV
ncbi:MAG: IS66 family transposase [Candidatus Aminicenantes bacterium]|nr:MAG: IS66 family transposase [Candidatus Aminicenantes bacterium]